MTPENIKAIARQIRAAETRTLGQKIPNTTALNAITKALGLGDTFAQYVSSYQPERTS